MAVLFARSASKHGITEAQVEFVVAHCGLVFDEPAPVGSSVPDDRALYLGDDENGVALEVAAIELEKGGLLVIHAMTLRSKYRERYVEALARRKLA